MKIAMAASEAAPYLKTGGLGDVMQALPQALAKLPKHEIVLVLPYYGAIKYSGQFETEFVGYFDVPLAWRREYVGVLRLKSRKKKLRVYFIDNEHYFCRDGGIYGHGDDGERFAYFSKAVLATLKFIGFEPDVLHCHDWQTALIPLLLKTEYAGAFPNTKSILTIHNIEYQGKCNLQFNYDVLGLPQQCDEILRFDDCTNFLKAGIVMADRVNTVSRTYAEELQYAYYAHGLADVLRSRGSAFSGITNGIDTQLYDPASMKGIAENFTPDTVRAGKLENKRALQKLTGLPQDDEVAVLAVVSRLVAHKGMDLLCYIAERLMQRRIQLVVAGTGEEKYEWFLAGLQYRFPQQCAARLQFDPRLANLIYAGADMFLMPSKSEPCGLAQLIAMRFGTIPVVNATGGLRDTVPPYNPETGTGCGFTFQSYNADDFLAAIDRSLQMFYDEPEKWLQLMRNDMAVDSSWEKPAAEYMKLYESAIKG